MPKASVKNLTPVESSSNSTGSTRGTSPSAKRSTGLTMDDLLAKSDLKQVKTGDVVEGTVNSVRKHEVWVDLGPNGMGVIFRREVGSSPLVEGETITASVIEPERDDGCFQ